MTREQAADLLDNMIGFIEDSQGSDYDEALKMAIEALKVYPNNEDTEEVPLKKYHVYATSEAEVTIDSEDELEISNEAYDEIIANMNFEIVREVE